jgi:2-C-methyl-D-erythritol 4-phosphate cytidylyltransferase
LILQGDENYHLDRNSVKIVQTPQVFVTSLIINAYKTGYLPEFTDDASVLEKAGIKINLVEGNKDNIKITTPEDLIIADAILKKMSY